jgi:hypothetical protein
MSNGFDRAPAQPGMGMSNSLGAAGSPGAGAAGVAGATGAGAGANFFLKKLNIGKEAGEGRRWRAEKKPL